MTPQQIDTDRTPPPPPRESTPPLGALIRHHRTRIGLTQRELADLSTISVRAIRDLEQNRVRRPRGETVQLIADGLRLGPRSREALSSAARRCRAGTADEGGPPAPPATLHPIIGRDRETEVITAELAGGAQRLLHLTGFSGTGKTRLAVEAATRLHRQQRMPVLWYTFPGSGDDCLVPCDPAVNGLPHRWVRWLFGPVADGGGAGVVPDDGPGPALREQLGDQPALLVIDGAPSRPAHPGRLTALLRGHPGLQLLVTSGEPWELPGERTFLLTGLDTDADDGPAGRLFWEQARRTRPELPASDASRAQAAEICRRLDGIPRALLAAASWLAVCDLPTLHRRLTEDPRPFLDQLAGPEHAGHYLDTLRDRLLRLRDDRRALLTALSVAADDGGEFSLDQVVTLTARPLAHCARTLRDLLLTGAVRQVSGPSGARFRVLGLVRTVLHDLAGSPAAVPAAPAAVSPNCSRSAAPTAASRTPLRVG
ncbi:helix-turn-helix domain-containing protein [Streptomyces tauricus]|uniref:helix-turn-helix domain-containing protein n=1 Tax=Streptomyces tauricus TaxID=68274 RepID=UPI00339FED50